jgi:serine phosphatase RsbU (regulator of sigma subunit)
VGGDFFDFIPLDHATLGIVVGDAAGKGIPAALFMALARSLVRAEAERAASPAAVLQSVNRHLLAMNETEMFVTLLYGVLHPASHTFTYVRAGHELPLVLNSARRVDVPPLELGEPLGVYSAPALTEQTLTIPNEGMLVLYTDGVTEARDARGGMFGMERLQEAVAHVPAGSAQARCEFVLETVFTYAGPTPQYDDATVVAVQAR